MKENARNAICLEAKSLYFSQYKNDRFHLKLGTVFISLLLTIFSIGCSSSHPQEHSDVNFPSVQGVTLCDSTLGLYTYKDTLYYYDAETKMLFKIPEGFEANNQNTYWGSGLRLNNQDSSITIYLDSFTGGWEELADGKEDGLYSWWAYCWDNADVKIDVVESMYGYTKIGFTPWFQDNKKTFKPIYEKCVLYHDTNSGWRPHLIRIEYPDSLSPEASNIIWEYIEPYPNVFYPNTSVK